MNIFRFLRRLIFRDTYNKDFIMNSNGRFNAAYQSSRKMIFKFNLNKTFNNINKFMFNVQRISTKNCFQRFEKYNLYIYIYYKYKYFLATLKFLCGRTTIIS